MPENGEKGVVKKSQIHDTSIISTNYKRASMVNPFDSSKN